MAMLSAGIISPCRANVSGLNSLLSKSRLQRSHSARTRDGRRVKLLFGKECKTVSSTVLLCNKALLSSTEKSKLYTHDELASNGDAHDASGSSLSNNFADSTTKEGRSSTTQELMPIPDAFDFGFQEEGPMVWMAVVEEGIFRFDASIAARNASFPSLAFEDANLRNVRLDTTWEPKLKPICKLENGQQQVMFKDLNGCSFYGTGEVSGSLERSGKQVTTWNTDAWGYSESTLSLYQSHPWVLVVQPDGSAFGVLADSTRRCEVDLTEEGILRFAGSAPYPVITFGPYDSASKVLRSLAKAIGTLPLPPLWSMGFHQCRWSYLSATRVEEVADTFRDKQLPCDVIWMDIDYMDGFRCFTFHPANYPNPEDLRNQLRSKGFRTVWMLDPGLKKEDSYEVYRSGCREAKWVLDSTGQPFVGDVWPGPCVFPDFTSSETRTWWTGLVEKFCASIADGIWNDMNEPSVFNSTTKTMPLDNTHSGDKALGGIQTHEHYHNVYGMLMSQATFEGMRKGRPNCRPFVLTRASYIGGQRYAATWTGDNLANWEHLAFSIPMSLNLGLSGQPFSGPDIGGFAGNASPRLFARWMGICCLFPFARAHSETGSADHEPWCFGPECEDVSRRALQRRYRLMRHLYTLACLTHKTGEPVMTPAFFADPKNQNLRKEEESFLLGPVLVVASVDPHQSAWRRGRPRPQGIWQQFDFADHHPELPLLYLKGGSIVPAGQVHQSTDTMREDDALELFIALDSNGKAEGVLYEDEGDGYRFQDGFFRLTKYQAHTVVHSDTSSEGAGEEVVLTVAHSHGSMPQPSRALVAHILLGGCAKVTAKGVDGQPLSIRLPSRDEANALVVAGTHNIQRIEEESVPLDNSSMEPKEAAAEEDKASAVTIRGGPWSLNIMLRSGARITSLEHDRAGRDLLLSHMDSGGYEELSSTGAKATGAKEHFQLIKLLQSPDSQQLEVIMEGDIDGGLAMFRVISVNPHSPESLNINSTIKAKAVGAGAGGFSRLACLRTRPCLALRNPPSCIVRFANMEGRAVEVVPDVGAAVFRLQDRPNGEWILVDTSTGEAIVNKFSAEEVECCTVRWGAGSCELELQTEERPVSESTPISLSHTLEYRTLK